MAYGDLIVKTAVLPHDGKQVVKRVVHLCPLQINHKVHLLVGFVIINIRATAYGRFYRSRHLTQHKAALQQHIVRIILAVYFQQVVAGQAR